MRLAILVLAGVGTFAVANPVATADATKVWERCIVAVNRTHAEVSCAIGYSIRSQASEPLYIVVPVFVPLATPKDRFAELVRAKLEIDTGGSVHTPVRYEDRGNERAPTGMKLVDCVFIFGSSPAKAFSIVASYQQPLHNGQFFYRPQFEDGNQARDAKSHSVTVFPTDEASIELISPKSPSDKVLATRITVTPEHQKLITIAVR
jgi:hypothetical protein